MAPLSEKEIGLVKKLKERLSENISDEFFLRDTSLVRWLRMYNNNLDKTEGAVKKHMQWRIENNIDNLLQENFSEVVMRNYPFKVQGTDKEGRPVVIVHFGKEDAQEITNGNYLDEYDRYVLFTVEKVLQSIKHNQDTQGLKNGSALEIIDLEGLSYSKGFTTQFFSHLISTVKTLDANYPNVVEKFIVINAPAFVNNFYKILKFVLSQNTKKQISVFGCDKSEWIPFLLENISQDQLCVEYGGDKQSQIL